MRRKRGRSFLLACCSGWPSRGEKENAERSSLCKQAWTPAANRRSNYHVSKSCYCGVRGSREPEQWTNPAADPGWFGNLQHTGERDDGVLGAVELGNERSRYFINRLRNDSFVRREHTGQSLHGDDPPSSFDESRSRYHLSLSGALHGWGQHRGQQRSNVFDAEWGGYHSTERHDHIAGSGLYAFR